jgi:hypothetical protein
MSPTNLSRRAILAGAASVPALALPAAVAIAAPPPTPVVKTAAVIEPDPILAAIAEHRRLDDEQFEMWCVLQDDEEDNPVWNDKHSRASDAAHEAAWTLTKIRPTTPTGATALFTYTCADVGLAKGAEWHLPALANAVIGAKQTAHPDAGLFDLGERILATAAEACAASVSHNEVEEIVGTWREQHPAPKTAKALARWRRQYAVVRRKCRYQEAEAKWSSGCDEIMELTEEIADFFVSTTDGIEIKKAVIASYENDRTVCLDIEDKITESIRRDLKHLKRIGAREAVQS